MSDTLNILTEEQIDEFVESHASQAKLSIEVLLANNIKLTPAQRRTVFNQVVKLARELRVKCLLIGRNQTTMHVRVKHESSLTGEHFIDIYEDE